jgi:hypothetical protein
LNNGLKRPKSGVVSILMGSSKPLRGRVQALTVQGSSPRLIFP